VFVLQKNVMSVCVTEKYDECLVSNTMSVWCVAEKYPEVKQLMGPNPRLKYIVTLMVLVQLGTAYLVRDASWFTIILLAYCFGGTINHSLSLAIHEISHNLAFGHSWPLANRLLGFWANLPLGVPMSISFKKYHLEHHRYQGDEEKDVDIPSQFECKFFQNTLSKFVWLLLQPFFYAIRPLFVRPKPLTALEVINMVIQFTVDYLLYQWLGGKALVYLISGTFLAMGAHPLAGHFISEHYMFVKGHETYSYYGPLNMLTWNVGYHNEHHDFPYVAGCNLPKVSRLAFLVVFMCIYMCLPQIWNLKSNVHAYNNSAASHHPHLPDGYYITVARCAL
jgi:sphingolipid delta-4 desaturase